MPFGPTVTPFSSASMFAVFTENVTKNEETSQVPFVKQVSQQCNKVVFPEIGARYLSLLLSGLAQACPAIFSFVPQSESPLGLLKKI